MEWIVSEQFLALSDSPLWAGLREGREATTEIRNTELLKYKIRNLRNRRNT